MTTRLAHQSSNVLLSHRNKKNGIAKDSKTHIGNDDGIFIVQQFLSIESDFQSLRTEGNQAWPNLQNSGAAESV